MNLKNFFKTCPIKPKTIASKADINYSTLRCYMAGTRDASAEMVFKIQAAVEQIAEELLKTKVR
jgi:predicted transcriptional regulator